MKYVHWLKIDGYSKIEETASQFLSIENYLNNIQKRKLCYINMIVALLIG